MAESDSDDEPPLLVDLGSQNAAGALDLLPRENEPSIVQDLPPCPVTILSGFLGSGKTTLIQYILKSPDHKFRIAVIENEFGEGLEVESMIAKDGVDNSSLADFIELPNGCVCCTVKDNLVLTLETLLQRRSDLDYILIEASGMANPGPIASVFWLDDELESRIRLDGVVTLVDAYHIEKQLQETLEASQQIAYADRILLNKVDLVQSTDDIRNIIHAMNPAAPIRTTTFSEIPDLKWILDTKCYEDKKGVSAIGATVEQVAATLGHYGKSNSNGDSNDDHNEDYMVCLPVTAIQKEHFHTSEISTIALVERGTMDFEKLNTFLASTLWPNQDEKDEILRSRLEQQLAIENGSEQQEQQQQQEAMTATQEQKQQRQQKEPHGSSSNQEPQQQIFRIKGVVSVRRDPEKTDSEELAFCDPQSGIDSRWYIIQSVYDLWEIHPSSETFEEEQGRECKLVVIGRHLQQEELKRGLTDCLI